MIVDFVVCPECHKQLEPELVRCKYCHAYVQDNSPWRKENNLLAIPTSIVLVTLFALFLRTDWFPNLTATFGDGISITILGLAIYGLVLLFFKNRVTSAQRETFTIVRQACSGQEKLTPELLDEVRTKIRERRLGAFNTLLAYSRLQWIIETIAAPREEREPMLHAMRDHAETDWESLDSSFSSAQFLIWLLPSLGFLGTVWGMTQALRGFSSTVSSQVSDLSFQNSLSETAQGLGVAFHTTLVGLAMVIPVLLFATSTRRRTQQLLERLDKFFIRLSTQIIRLPAPTDDTPEEVVPEILPTIPSEPMPEPPPIECIDESLVTPENTDPIDDQESDEETPDHGESSPL
ncbi:hypothetical protein BVY04_04140 [bacterium M21]|nr:hypothetical protein BVY04_04140 [bacterium M21]